jgi:hypothetical protein
MGNKVEKEVLRRWCAFSVPRSFLSLVPQDPHSKILARLNDGGRRGLSAFC